MRPARTTVTWMAVLAVAAAIVADHSAWAAGATGRSAITDRIAYSTDAPTPDSPSAATAGVYSSTPAGKHPRLIAPDATSPAWASGGRWLAYVRGYAEIWRVRADGTGKQRVSRRGWIASQPAWSPDGKRLAYVRTWEIMVGGYPEQRSAIYLVRRDGTGTRRLHSGWGPAWSPDGRVIAFTYQGSSLAAIRPDGRHFRQLREDVAPGQAQFGPVGRRLVFIDVPIGGASVVRILDMRTGRLRAVPKDPSGEQPQSVTWTPDGRRLAYFRNRWISVGDTRRVGAVELCVVRPDGSGRRRLATLPSEVMSWEGLSWSR